MKIIEYMMKDLKEIFKSNLKESYGDLDLILIQLLSGNILGEGGEM